MQLGLRQLYAPLYYACQGDGPIILRIIFSPFLKMGLTLALIQSDGNLPVARDFSKISWMIGAIYILYSLSTIGLLCVVSKMTVV